VNFSMQTIQYVALRVLLPLFKMILLALISASFLVQILMIFTIMMALALPLALLLWSNLSSGQASNDAISLAPIINTSTQMALVTKTVLLLII